MERFKRFIGRTAWWVVAQIAGGLFSGGVGGAVAAVLEVPPIFQWIVASSLAVIVVVLLRLKWPTPPIRPQTSASRQAAIVRWRHGMDVLAFWHGREFLIHLRNSQVYSEMRPHLSDEVRTAIEGNGDADLPADRKRGERPLYNAVMDDIAAQEWKWELLV